jgi:hypothetical protein
MGYLKEVGLQQNAYLAAIPGVVKGMIPFHEWEILIHS